MIKGLRVIESMWFDNVGIVKTDSDLGIKYYIGYRKNHQDIPQAEKIIAYKGTEVSLPLLKIFFGLSDRNDFNIKEISQSVMKRREAMMWWSTLSENDKRGFSKSSPNALTGSMIEALYVNRFG